MEYLSLFGAIVSVNSIISFFKSKRFSELINVFICIPIICQGFMYKDTVMNGLITIVHLIILLTSIVGNYGLIMWNEKVRKRNTPLLIIFTIINVFIIIYTQREIPLISLSRYIPHYELGQGAFMIFIIMCRWILIAIFVLLLAYMLTTVNIRFIDRFFTKSNTLILLNCEKIVASKINNYHIKGINNGKEYYFNVRKDAFFYNFRNGCNAVLKARYGILGGIYITNMPECGENRKEKYLKRFNNFFFILRAIFTLLCITVFFMVK